MARPVAPETDVPSLPLSGGGPKPAAGAFTGLASALLHAAALAAVVVVPLLTDDRLPDQAGQVEAFFASPIELTAPPPPPPPPSAARAAVRAARPVSAGGFVAPVEVPTDIVPEAALDLAFEGGLAGGVEGGVPGGVVGGIVGGLPDAPPPPPTGPVRVGLEVQEPRKLKHVPPVYPLVAAESRLEGVVILECLIDPRGRVVDVKLVRGLPLLDEAATDAVRQWVYTPTLINGVPTPVIMTVKVTFRLAA